MTESESGVEIIPGVRTGFTKTGIDADVLNAWMPNSMRAVMGKFDELEPVKYYGEYFQGEDRKYEEAGKPGLFRAIMERSNPETVAAFDQLVDEFNAALPRIKEAGDNEAVQTFFRRAGELRNKPVDI